MYLDYEETWSSWFSLSVEKTQNIKLLIFVYLLLRRIIMSSSIYILDDNYATQCFIVFTLTVFFVIIMEYSNEDVTWMALQLNQLINFNSVIQLCLCRNLSCWRVNKLSKKNWCSFPSRLVSTAICYSVGFQI